MPPDQRPTDRELEILGVLWRRGQATVREVHDELAAEHATGYTTTLKLMQLMREKGLVVRDATPRPHIYRAAEVPSKTQRRVLGRLIDRVFAGSTSALVLQALDAGAVSAAEIAEIRRLIDDYECGDGGDSRESEQEARS